ncbi:restriction endonuclease [Natronosalvus vescus]|uniref:restriction endonuclease n=1 Tax=Natronosalvus vescus TaxID=2953881 RepID=UPI0020909C48|nr:restriction endonuclease [Natronosalvus vescus]
MAETKLFPYNELSDADLVVDAVYEGGDANNLSAALLPDLLGVGTGGGFRAKRCPTDSQKYSYVVLYTTFSEPDWPDDLDRESGIFTYYGDNRDPGSRIHEKDGNKILREVFHNLHSGQRQTIPPFFVFTKEEGWNRKFRGLAVPGDRLENQSEDLVAVWKHNGGDRFQNYKATFTILDVDRVSRAWISDLQEGKFLTENTPDVWAKWKNTGKYTPLQADRTKDHRTKVEQLPTTEKEKTILQTVYSHCKNDSNQSRKFEYVASALFELMDSNVHQSKVTRQSRDGGRDAIGTYHIGSIGDSVDVEFALEAKCYKPSTGVGVHDTSRLISRLRHRQFGVFVTTSYVRKSAYEEIKQDGHPVLVLSGGDIAKILQKNGFTSKAEVKNWLDSQGPA